MDNDRAPITRRAPIGMAGVTALTLAVVGLLLLVFTFPLMKFVGLFLAVAALVVGVVGGINARRQAQAGSWLGWTGAALGAAGVIWFIAWWSTAGL